MSSVNPDGASLITPESVAAQTITRARSEPAPGEFETAMLDLAVYHSAMERLVTSGAPAAKIVREAFERLQALRQKYHPAVWLRLVEAAQNHPVAEYFLADPITHHSFEKPRGYSGDAGLLDLIYGHQSAQQSVDLASPQGRDVYDQTWPAPAAAAVRERRELLTQEVDRVAQRLPGEAEILTIAAGHLREANASRGLQERQIRRWIALDQDPMSVGTMTRDWAGTVVDVIDGSVRGLLRGDYKLGQFDLIYAAGLYDYLPRAVAIKLTRRCMAMLKPGGSFLYANFAQGISDAGYMEVYMDWQLLLRDDADMWDIANASVDRNRVNAEVFSGENGNIIYGRLTRKD